MFCKTVFLNANLKPSKLQDHFNNRHDGANILGHDFESKGKKDPPWTTRNLNFKLPKLGFVPADKPLLIFLYTCVNNKAFYTKLYFIKRYKKLKLA